MTKQQTLQMLHWTATGKNQNCAWKTQLAEVVVLS